MTGQGEAVWLAEFDGRWYIAPAKVRISGGGWGPRAGAGRPPRAHHGRRSGRDADNDRFELLVHRTPTVGTRPPIGLVATWNSQPDPVVIAEVSDTNA
jgi:hypothetical protein